MLDEFALPPAIEAPISTAARAYAREKIREIRADLAVAPRWSDRRGQFSEPFHPTQPTFSERVAATRPAPDPDSVWAIPDEWIEKEAAAWEDSQIPISHPSDDYEPDPWNTRKDLT